MFVAHGAGSWGGGGGGREEGATDRADRDESSKGRHEVRCSPAVLAQPPPCRRPPCHHRHWPSCRVRSVHRCVIAGQRLLSAAELQHRRALVRHRKCVGVLIGGGQHQGGIEQC